MASKPATPGTGFTGPLYVLDSKGQVVYVLKTAALAALPTSDSVTDAPTQTAAVKAILDALRQD